MKKYSKTSPGYFSKGRMMLGVIIFIIASLIFGIGKVLGQETAVTTSGKKVILNSDGTWKYTEQTQPSTPVADGNCGKLISKNEDKMTGKIFVSSSTILVSNDGGKSGFGIFAMLVGEDRDGIVLSIQAIAPGVSGCMKENSEINVLFTDNTRLKLINGAKFNCKGNTTVYFKGGFGLEDELELLKTKKIKTMRVWASSGYVEKDFTDKQAADLQTIFGCIESQK